jgi:hypothetical protein
MRKIAGSGAGSESGYVSQRYGSVDPDPHHNVTDPQHWVKPMNIVPFLRSELPVNCRCPDLVREMAGLVHIFRNFEEFRQNLDDDGIEDDVQRLAP